LLYREASGQSRNVVTTDNPSPRELLAAYGENNLARHQIPLGSGTVTVQGSGIPENHTVWVGGHQVPIDSKGNFIAEQILPDGTHTVEVAVLDDGGNGSLYLRDLQFKRTDLFFVGVADVTVSQNGATGPIDLFQGQNGRQPYDSSLDGRLALYANGKVRGRWRLTTSADTREGPVKSLFSNFLDKSPDSLFRRINPEYHYPAFGDDSVVTEMAPTLGKFYLKASHGENYGMWGNFSTGYTGNELAHVDRGLYGGNVHYGVDSTTSFGERRFTIDAFAAQPGTLSSYEEYRGTGGSLYFLRHQDILMGSERVRVEIRDKDSRIVVGVVNLQPNVDYNIDYLQGRLLLTQPLASTADDNMLVHSSSSSGNEAFLVARYEYSPGFTQLDALSAGGQSQFWLNNYIKLGLTANSNREADSSNTNLGAADMTLRISAKSFLKVQAGRSEGLVASTLQSNDGGFGFQTPGDLSSTDSKAGAYRADLSVGIGDFLKGREGVFTFYKQSISAGYSAPGQLTLKDTEQYGGTLRMPVTNRLSLSAKGDQRIEEQGLLSRAVELDVVYKLTEKLGVSTGVRNDLRNDRSPVVPLTQKQGERTDAVAQITFVPGSTWRTYGFIQDTVATRGGREGNRRVGAGGSYRLTKRFRVDGEASDGDLGPGGKVGTTFLFSDLTNLYLNYSLDNEREYNGTPVRQGNLISGVRGRLSDSSSVYVEQRYQNGASRGLTRTTGINLVPKERWNFGGSTEIGTLRDSLTGAATDRKAAGIHLGYGRDTMQFSSAIEFRRDNAEQLDLTPNKTSAWLFRNNVRVQLTPSWRMIGKLDHSMSESSLGAFYAGGYTEGVVGYAFRPVRHNRLNALAKYTYFYNVPTTEQVTVHNAAVEFIQKSHISSLDLSYNLTPNWTVGSKYAYRLGQASLDRTQLKFSANSAQLAVIRVDRRFRKNWDAMAEVRMLTLKDIQQRRRGALTTVYRHLGSNLKIGVGYNFTDFSDDLTDLGYNHKGVFVNIIGTK
jgi:hypothetical protein